MNLSNKGILLGYLVAARTVVQSKRGGDGGGADATQEHQGGEHRPRTVVQQGCQVHRKPDGAESGDRLEGQGVQRLVLPGCEGHTAVKTMPVPKVTTANA